MNHKQIKASDPGSSVWVCASAGTGKTKILSDRVLRLLLKGSPPAKILCLTFTNAACGEMLARIKSKLLDWANKDEQSLKEDLLKIEGKEPGLSKISEARKLYEKLLDSKEKIGVLTIHSFCQKILKNFPFEAGVNPKFKILSEIERNSIIKKLKLELFIKEPEIAELLVSRYHENILHEIFDEIIKDRIPFEKLHEQKFSPSEEEIKKSIKKIESFEKLSGKKITDFVNKNGKAKKTIAKNVEDLREEFYKLEQKKREEQSSYLSKIITAAAIKFIGLYKRYKEKNDLLDYEDLIYLTKKLLAENENKDWVLYKLDGGIDHLLLDEAQDTSKEQWDIVNSLIKEFYSGEGARNENRTIFVVGDAKQSIYSFQGADVDYFERTRKETENNFKEAGKNFEILNLDLSYRSSRKIVDSVYKIFAEQDLMAGEEKVTAVKESPSSSIELWDLPKFSEEQRPFWPFKTPNLLNYSKKEQVASAIALSIKKFLELEEPSLHSEEKVKPSDFMILVRNRNDFIDECIKSLSSLSIPFSGIDRMRLDKSLPILDLISIAKFVLSPEDDLNLASLLKSPIIGMEEQDLYELSATKGKDGLWKNIKSEKKLSPVKNLLENFISLRETTDSVQFFYIIIEVWGFKEKLISSEPEEGEDSIREFLYLASEYSEKISSSLQELVYWFQNNEKLEIKRNVENSEGVKITTVHSSKGLESPIIILCDDVSYVSPAKNFYLWDKNNEHIAASLGSEQNPEFFEILKKDKELKREKEDLRLLYVALTRAADHIIVCGYGNKRNSGVAGEKSWYSLFKQKSKIEPTALPEYKGFREDNEERLGEKFAPNFTHNYLPMVKAAESKIISVFELAKNMNKMEHGKIFHKILEDSLKSGRPDLALDHPLAEALHQEGRERIKRDLSKLLSNPDFMDLGKFNLKMELNVGIEKHGIIKIARIDLLVEKEEEIIIIDYKSDLNPPKDHSQTPAKYIEQLKIYAEAARAIYPSKKISCKILWLSSGKFSDVMALLNND